jgi:hypothetical protein
VRSAAKAVADGKGFQFVSDLVHRHKKIGLTEAGAIAYTRHVLWEYRQKDAATASALLAHLSEYVDKVIRFP